MPVIIGKILKIEYGGKDITSMTRYKTPNQRFVEDVQEFISETGQERGNVSAMQAAKSLSYLKDNLLDWVERFPGIDGIYLFRALETNRIYSMEVGTYNNEKFINGIHYYLYPKGYWYGPIEKYIG